MAAPIVAACEKRPTSAAILVVADGYTGRPPKPVGPQGAACLTQAGTADRVPNWIDAIVLNPAD
jgi:hypothetical protein